MCCGSGEPSMFGGSGGSCRSVDLMGLVGVVGLVGLMSLLGLVGLVGLVCQVKRRYFNKRPSLSSAVHYGLLVEIHL